MTKPIEQLTARELHEIGLQDVIDKHAASDKLGVLRGGNSGCLVDGIPVGTASACPRRAYLRMIGVDVGKPDIQSQIMFDGGHANEDYFFERVRRAWPGKVVNESDYPSSWSLASGTEVTGSPDGVLLLGENDQPVRGIELKGVFSLWTARDVLQGRPKMDNLMQAAHYMFALGLSKYELVYVSRSYYATNDMAKRYLPKSPEDMYGQYMQYRYYHWRPKKRGSGLTKAQIEQAEYEAGAANNSYVDTPRDGRQLEYQLEASNVLPFCISYEMEHEDGVVKWRRTDLGDVEWNTSVITWQGIKDYYQMADGMRDSSSKLPPKPNNIKCNGKSANYNGCFYCPLNSVCETKSETVGAWLRKVEDHLGG